MPTAGRRRITLHARIGTHEVLKVGFAAAGFARHRTGRSLSDPRSAAGRRDGGGLGAGRTASRPESRSTSRSPRPRAALMSTSAAPARLGGLIAALSRVADKHRLARLTRHGELVLMRTPRSSRSARPRSHCRPARSCRQRPRARDSGHARGRHCEAANRSPICSAASAPSRSGSPQSRGLPRSTARPTQSPLCRRQPRPGPEAGQGRSARPVPPPLMRRSCATMMLSCSTRRDRARSRKRSNSPRADACGGRGILQSRHSRATPDPDRGGYRSKASRRSTSSATPRMWSGCAVQAMKAA